MTRLISTILILLCGLISAQHNITHDVYFETDEYTLIPTEENRLLLEIVKWLERDFLLNLLPFLDFVMMLEHRVII